MGTKDLWLPDTYSGADVDIPAGLIETSASLIKLKELPQITVHAMCDKQVYAGYGMHLGQCLALTSVDMPDTIAEETLLADIGVRNSVPTFEVYDVERGLYSGIEPKTLIKAVAKTSNDISNKRPYFEAVISGLAYCLVDAGETGRYIEVPTEVGLNKLSSTESENKVTGLIDGLLTAPTTVTVAIVTLGGGGTGTITLGRLTSGGTAGVATFKMQQIFSDGTTSSVGEDIAGIILKDY